jgi:hypothetical protein
LEHRCAGSHARGFKGQIEHFTIDELGFSVISAEAQDVRRTSRLIARGREDYALINQSGWQSQVSAPQSEGGDVSISFGGYAVDTEVFAVCCAGETSILD